jgi:metal-responsive CopG/Arc/MetJ family transcriptional regulator
MVSKDNTRIIVSLPKELKAKLEEIAKSENRSLSNYVVNILRKVAEK